MSLLTILHRSRWKVFAALLALALLMSRAASSPAEDSPPARAARISYLKGNVSFQPGGHDQWSEATLNFTVTTGDRIYTDKNARAELEMGPYTVRLAEDTDLAITNLNDQIMQLGLEQGTLRLSVYELSSGNTVEVDTPNAALTVSAPGTYRAGADPSGNLTFVSVNSGSMEITAEGVSQTLQAGQAVKLTGQGSIQVSSIPMPSLDSFDKWCEKRDARLSASGSAKYVSRGSPGYADLDDYGRWEEVADYGPVWYPGGVAAGWVPYRYGHWAWVDPWGWTWVEDEPWGFCPFHYGRWLMVGAVWGWLPGPYVAVPVYAPAFVAFMGGPSFSISVDVGPVSLAAWFPLAPGEPYFPWYHYSEDYLRVVNVTNIRNVTNITNITNVTNISEVHYKYRTVAATAVPASVLSSGQPVFRHVVRVSPEQLSRAAVIPHPPVNPTVRAALPGKPVAPPPVRSTRVAERSAPTTWAGAPRSAPGESRQPPPLAARGRSPENDRKPSPEPQPRAPVRENREPSRLAPPLTTRIPPPPPRIPFMDQRRSMLEHPGRPLEPHQLDNLRAGRPAGPMLDREFPPHVAPVPRERLAPPPPAQPRPRRP